LTEFKQSNCECKEVVSRVTSWIDCQSIQSVLSVEAEQKVDTVTRVGLEPMACVLWTRFLQHNQANPEVLLARLRLEIDRHDALHGL
jgi:hypothetical protein